MKTTKRLIATILALSILLSVLAGITASALELDESVIDEGMESIEELIATRANSCEHTCSFTNNQEPVVSICERCRGNISATYGYCTCGKRGLLGVVHKCFGS